MKKVAFIALLLGFTSCTQRGCQATKVGFEFSEREYIVDMYSGGRVVFTDTFRGIVNGEEGTDGFYYLKGDTLIEVGGDYVLKSVK